MVKQKVIIVHASAIVQKGLADILRHTCDVSVSQIISQESEIPLVARLKKSVLFVDIQWVIRQKLDLHVLKRNGNSVCLVAYHPDTVFAEGPFDDLLLLEDDLPAIQKKLAVIFPQQTKPVADQAELTLRETEVLKLVARGSSNKDIADELSISLHTVISHRKNICRKLEIKTISGLTLYALINNLIS